jgi:hypothetical protein
MSDWEAFQPTVSDCDEFHEHQAGVELEQIQFLVGHVSVQTTERYLRCKQRLRNAVHDRLGIEPDCFVTS